MSGTKKVPKWLKIAATTLISLVILFYLAGGFLFSNMIRADALTPQGPTPDNGVYVVAVGDGSITLTAEEERDDIARPGVAGLAWEGGRGQIGPIVESTGLEVTREFTEVSGGLPPVCVGPLAECEQIDIDSWMAPNDPSDLGLDFNEVGFSSPLGALGAWQVDSGEGDVWAIHAHGWRAARREALRSLPIFHDAGITSLVIDYRNDDGAPDDPSGLYRFGRTEWEDVESAVEFAIENGAEEIILVGYSTGAALHLAFLENSDLAGEVVLAVFDSPNADMGSAIEYEASKRSIPGTSIPVPNSLAAVAMFVADLRWDIGWEEIDYVERAGDIVSTPTLVFRGEDDDRVPIEVSRRLRDQAPELIELIVVPDAGHVTSWNVDPDGYTTELYEFLGTLDT